MGKTTTRKSQIKKILKRDLVSNRKYKTTYKDIKKYFGIINKSVFNNMLAPFNDIKIKKIYKDETKKYCYGQVTVWEWKRKGTQQFHLEMQPHYRNKLGWDHFTNNVPLWNTVLSHYFENRSNLKFLELGSGTGMHTGCVLEQRCSVIATDISKSSLEVLEYQFRDFANLKTLVCDMENLPFSETFCGFL